VRCSCVVSCLVGHRSQWRTLLSACTLPPLQASLQGHADAPRTPHCAALGPNTSSLGIQPQPLAWLCIHDSVRLLGAANGLVRGGLNDPASVLYLVLLKLWLPLCRSMHRTETWFMGPLRPVCKHGSLHYKWFSLLQRLSSVWPDFALAGIA
jgi:hypothetical protein